ncbi:MAG TPA: amylo-alpha-1,6-glucosidase, partial [Bacteroidota bacterium]|nr:amylo-alpha-1,6-glucosidase [Bacteroidota bacterium]
MKRIEVFPKDQPTRPARARGARAAEAIPAATGAKIVRISLAIVLVLASSRLQAQDALSKDFSGLYGQVEVGGPYAGAEFHHSCPFPSRISFYEPAANSIDLSRDYWKRDLSHPVVAAARIDGGERRSLGDSPWPYTLSPHRVEFHKVQEGLSWASRYAFFKNLPGLVWTLTCRNSSSTTKSVELYLHLRTVLRTCQTYAWMDSAWTEYEPSECALAIHFDQSQTREAAVIVENLGARPKEWTSRGDELGPEEGDPLWVSAGQVLDGALLPHDHQGPPAAAFVYRETLAPSESLVVTLGIISLHSVHPAESERRLRAGWRDDLSAYDAEVRHAAEGVPQTGEKQVDASAAWAGALLVTNAHVLGGKIVPMPCPAEYNFFFTHDVLLTNLSAVFFNTPRVKRDLLTIASLSEGGIIPHAWYWRDDGLKTELCTPDNWNHLWFIEVVGRYLRHTMDTATVSQLYPLVEKSLSEVLRQCKSDSLMYAYRPDWWDIGHKEGPRAYITILTIRALQDYLFINSALGRRNPTLHDKELLCAGMQRALMASLWDNDRGYLMNANGPDKDKHIYMGSLLAVAYDLIPPARSAALMETARRVLLDRRLGVRTVMPTDFHLDSVRAYFHFPTNEAGDPFFYINGGVWPHANAWYAQALCACGRVEEARRFFISTMTLDGICSSPMGQPA